MPPDELAEQLSSGLLSFPVTHFSNSFDLDLHRYREHVSWLTEFDVAGLFAAGGTGEGFSLTPDETAEVVGAAIAEVAGAVPVVAPASGATRQAIAQAQSAERAGAAGILLLPPYLTEAPQRGLVRHITAVCRATSLGVVVYSRANAVLSAEAVAEAAELAPNLVGLKDGVGDLELLTRTVTLLGDRLAYIGGLPTAEMFAAPMLRLGVTTYSSAMFNFLPEFALRFYRAVRANDRKTVDVLLRELVVPYTRLRDREPGYAVSIVKAGLDIVGRDGGLVRPPLADLTDTQRAELGAIVDRAPRLLDKVEAVV